MLISNINPHELTPEQFINILYPGDPIESECYGDCIMVFGNGSLDRARKAIELFHAGKAPLIIFSGGDKWGKEMRLRLCL